MDIDGANILVTGGCGMIGSATIDLLLSEAAPARILILDNLLYGSINNLGEALKDPRVTLMCCDIRDANSVRRATQGMDVVIHMAALRMNACKSDAREAFGVMCEGSFNVVEAARRAGVRKLVAASSSSIYGWTDSLPTREDHHPYNDRTWFGATKVMLEGLLRSYYATFGLPYVVLRYCDVYGPRMDVEGKYTELLIRWMQGIAAGQPPVVAHDWAQSMDFIYVDDVARSNLLSLKADVVDDVFNIASGTETSLRELAETLLKTMGFGSPPRSGLEQRPTPVLRRVADASKAEKVLGFKAAIGLEEGLSRLVEWWQTSMSEKAH